MQLIVLSAGKGSRLPEKFRKKPKCLVELNSRPLLTYNKDFFKKFDNKIIVSGYKNTYLKKVINELGFKNIINKNYSTTNMVYSLFLAKKSIKDDVVIVYGDIMFSKKIYKLLKLNKDILPLNVNWLNNWKKRMPMKKILEDAENVVIKGNRLLEIGTKINKKKLPKYQFMGIIKLRKVTFMKLFNYFKKLKNKKIDMTTFINLCVLNKIISLKVKKFKHYWFEIDTVSDHKFTEAEIKKW